MSIVILTEICRKLQVGHTVRHTETYLRVIEGFIHAFDGLEPPYPSAECLRISGRLTMGGSRHDGWHTMPGSQSSSSVSRTLALINVLCLHLE